MSLVRPGGAAARARGFTMLEVVAAIGIITIWYFFLVTLAGDSTARERESKESLEASLIADEALADAEAALVAGGVPQPYDSTAPAAESAPRYGDGFGGDLYDVRVAVEPFDALAALGAIEGTSAPPLDLSLDALPKDAKAAAATALLRVRVEVRRVTDVEDALATGAIEPPPLAARTTFAIDPALLASLESAGASAPAPTGRDESTRDRDAARDDEDAG
ncbi:MAG: hypothetical protein R3E88_09460 [Myxococcota bacterium]|nr:hypothetical protein [Myxococcales bacterium]